MRRTELNIFSYTDYRAFLKDRLDELKRWNEKYSRRYLVRRLKLANSNYLKMLIDGTKPLTDTLLAKLVLELGLTEDESSFFVKLAHYGQARSTLAKSEALDALRSHRRFSNVHALDLSQFDYMTDPVALALREWAVLPGFEEDPKWLAKRMIPRSTPRAVKNALERLVALGILVRDESGRLAAPHAHQSTGSQFGNVPLRTYHRKMLETAVCAMDRPVEERSYSGLTFTASEEVYRSILERYAKFLNEVRALLDGDANPDRVCHMEMAIFPLFREEKNAGQPES